MDVTTLITPAAQQVASAIAGEALKGLREMIARRVGRGRKQETGAAMAEFDATAVQAAAERAAGDEEAAVGRWANYLAALIASRPDLADLLESLAEGRLTQPRTEVHNQFNGNVYGKSLIVDGDVHGGITM